MSRIGRGWQYDWFGAWPWVPARYEGVQSVLVRADVSAAGVTVHMDASDGQALTLEVRVRPPVGVALNGFALDDWSMSRGLPFDYGPDPFTRILRWANYLLTKPPKGSPASSTASCKTLNHLDIQVAGLACAAAERCEPRARAVARRFSPRDRLRVYGAIVNDASGRVGELALTAPGALLFALALEHRSASGNAASRRFLADVAAGRKLKTAVDEVVSAWAPGPAQERILGEQRLLVRRAGPLVPSALLYSPPPLSFVPEDIPRSAGANAVWYRVVKSLDRLLVGHEATAESPLVALSRFLSANAVELRRRTPRTTQLRSTIENLATWVVTTGSTVGRRATVGAVLSRCNAWLDGVENEARSAPARALGDAPLAPPPFADVAIEGFRICALRTAADLCREADEMDNCLASRWGDALRGSSAFYSATIDGRRLSVELIFNGIRWDLGAIKARSNTPPTDREGDLVSAWLEDPQRQTPCCRSRS